MEFKLHRWRAAERGQVSPPRAVGHTVDTHRSTRPTVLFAGGITGGHLFPGIAVAEALNRQQPGIGSAFATVATGFERTQIARYGFALYPVAAKPVRARFSDLAANGSGVVTAIRLIRRLRPSVVVGLGSYSSVPALIAACLLRIPIVLLEQNLNMGRANQLFAPIASAVCTSFETTRCVWSSARLLATGNPVRQEIVQSQPPSQGTRRQLLVLGGSQGASSLNRMASAALAQLPQWRERWRVVHQTGATDLQRTRDAHRSVGWDAEVVPFLDDIADAYRRCDLVVCRAGGTTLAEVAVMGKPAIAIPYPHATDDHQRANALFFSEHCRMPVVSDESQLPGSVGRLVESLDQQMGSSTTRESLAAALKAHSHPCAAARVAALVGHHVKSPHGSRPAVASVSRFD